MQSLKRIYVSTHAPMREREILIYYVKKHYLIIYKSVWLLFERHIHRYVCACEFVHMLKEISVYQDDYL
jgi:hypothetical protein